MEITDHWIIKASQNEIIGKATINVLVNSWKRENAGDEYVCTVTAMYK